MPERSGTWNSIYQRFARWVHDGTWDWLLMQVQAQSDAAGQLNWVVAVDSTIARVHQHGATLSRGPGGWAESHELWQEPSDHAIGRSRAG